jgi:hypothetical protein
MGVCVPCVHVWVLMRHVYLRASFDGILELIRDIFAVEAHIGVPVAQSKTDHDKLTPADNYRSVEADIQESYHRVHKVIAMELRVMARNVQECIVVLPWCCQGRSVILEEKKFTS